MINSAAVEANANVKVELLVWASSSDVLTLRLRTRSSADDPRDARLQGAVGAPGNRTNAMTIRPREAIFSFACAIRSLAAKRIGPAIPPVTCPGAQADGPGFRMNSKNSRGLRLKPLEAMLVDL